MNHRRRRIEIVRQLDSEYPITAEALAETFGVSPRTIYRDMRTLIDQGVPISGEAGSGYRISNNGAVGSLPVSLADAEVLISALEPSPPRIPCAAARTKPLSL